MTMIKHVMCASESKGVFILSQSSTKPTNYATFPALTVTSDGFPRKTTLKSVPNKALCFFRSIGSQPITSHAFPGLLSTE